MFEVFLTGSVPVPPVRFLVPVPPVPVLTGASSRLPVGTAAFLKVAGGDERKWIGSADGEDLRVHFIQTIMVTRARV